MEFYVPGQTSAQASLVEPSEGKVSCEPSQSLSTCSTEVKSNAGNAGEPRSKQIAGTAGAVSPLVRMPLGEVCAFCGLEVRPPGFVILDYEELGAFCNEECADRKFRLCLVDGARDVDDSTSA